MPAFCFCQVIKKNKLNAEELAVVHDEVEIMHKVSRRALHLLSVELTAATCSRVVLLTPCTLLSSSSLSFLFLSFPPPPQVNHPNCVQLFEMFENSKKMFMVLELLTGGELFDRIVKKGSYSEKEASEVVKSVTGALQYLHENGIVHRDLKPGQRGERKTERQRCDVARAPPRCWAMPDAASLAAFSSCFRLFASFFRELDLP